MGNDIIGGGKGADTLLGGLENETLGGGLQNDLLYGGAGADSLDGGQDANVLYSGAGNDTLRLSKGDTTTGGEGADEFVSGNKYTDDTNQLNTSNSYATITDFNSAEGDEIIVEIPSNPADGNYTLSVAENPAGSGTYDVSLTQTGGGPTTVVAKVTGGVAGLSTASDSNVKLVKQ